MNAQQVELYYNRNRKQVVKPNILISFLLRHDELCNLKFASVYCKKRNIQNIVLFLSGKNKI